MFQFGRFPSLYLCIQSRIYGSSPYGFPHSEICGSKLICSSPQLIAACHVLLRLLMPRHSPCALVRLNFPLSLDSCSLLWIAWVSFKQNLVYSFAVILPLLSLSCSYHLSVKLCFTLYFGKTYILLISLNICPLYLFVLYSNLLYSIFNEHIAFASIPSWNLGGLKWTRTTDLALIRRAL